MTTVWVLVLFALVLIGGFVVFLAIEALALSSKTDNIFTLSTYIKRWRRRRGWFGSYLLGIFIWGSALWLFGHLVMEWW
jgi:hypothetical protein